MVNGKYKNKVAGYLRRIVLKDLPNVSWRVLESHVSVRFTHRHATSFFRLSCGLSWFRHSYKVPCNSTINILTNVVYFANPENNNTNLRMLQRFNLRKLKVMCQKRKECHIPVTDTGCFRMGRWAVCSRRPDIWRSQLSFV